MNGNWLTWGVIVSPFFMGNRKILNSSLWNLKLSRILNRSSPTPSRLAIIGVGQTLCGDDGAGPAVIDRLKQIMEPCENLLLINCGHAPENCFGPIIRFAPNEILFIDAIRTTAPPGTICWLNAHEADSAGSSTHTLSLGMLATYLAGITGSNAYVLGICPSSLEFNEALSRPVEAAVEEIVATIAAMGIQAPPAAHLVARRLDSTTRPE